MGNLLGLGTLKLLRWSLRHHLTFIGPAQTVLLSNLWTIFLSRRKYRMRTIVYVNMRSCAFSRPKRPGQNTTSAAAPCCVRRQGSVQARSVHFLSGTTIPQDDRIDDLATLHTAFRGELQLTSAVQQIHAEVAHHEPAASAACRLMLDDRRGAVICGLFNSGFLRHCSCHDHLHRIDVQR